MKKSFLGIIFLLLLVVVSPIIAGPFDDVNIYFLNGMFNELSEASDSAKALRALSLPDAPEANVQYLYNQNEDFLAQMIEIFNQSGMDGSREKFKNFWFWVNRMDLAPPRFIDRVLYPTLAKFDEYTYTRDVDLQMMIAELQRQASNGKKKIASPFFATPDGTSQSPSGAKNWRRVCLRRPAFVLRPRRCATAQHTLTTTMT